MDVREKLVELLGACPCESDCEGMVGSCQNRKYGYCNEIFKLSYCSVSKLAQHLIANGVTVQEQENFREVTEKVEPLTLDELRQMYGEPVWAIGGDGTSEYVLIDKDGDGIDADTGFWDSDFYGLPGDGAHGLNVLGWLAYRRKPEEDDQRRTERRC